MVKHKIARWYRHHPHAKHYRVQRTVNGRVRTGDWWKWPFESLACSPIYGPGYKAHCENAQDEEEVWDGYAQKSLKLTVSCGGSAIIGYVGGRAAGGAGRPGYIGAAGAAASCFWGKMSDAWAYGS